MAVRSGWGSADYPVVTFRLAAVTLQNQDIASLAESLSPGIGSVTQGMRGLDALPTVAIYFRCEHAVDDRQK